MKNQKIEFLAKSDPKQNIWEHTLSLLGVMETMKKISSFDDVDWDLLTIIIILHDLGKINQKFQAKIRESDKDNIKKITKKELPHNLLSGAFIKNIINKLNLINDKDKVNIVYKSVLFHHRSYLYYASKPQRYSFDKVQESIYEDIEKFILGKVVFNDSIRNLSNEIDKKLGITNSLYLEHLDYDFYNFYNEQFLDYKNKNKFILIKGMLHLCDHIASSGFISYDYCFNENTINNIDDKLKEFLSKELNKDKKEIKFFDFQNKCAELKNSNLFTEAFTGSGKTIADHRWVGLRKFYLVPTKVSAEAFYLDAEKIYNNQKEEESLVGIIHGEASLYITDENETSIDKDSLSITNSTYELTKNFSKPYIISTIDQICTAIFKYPGYEKVLASLKNSKITVDEVHLLSPRMYLLLLYLLSFLQNENFQIKFHLMTATMPNIYREYLHKFELEYKENQIKIEETDKALVKVRFENFKNVKQKKDFFIKILREQKNVLIVVNSIKQVKKIYDLVKKDVPEINLLHSQFKFIDKKNKYKSIKDSKGVWITTQMVEVALDIDYPVVISELSPLESQIQRMGRCNRHKKGDEFIGEYTVFEDNTKKGKEKTFAQISEKIYSLNEKATPIKETKKIIENLLKGKKKLNVLNQKKRKELLDEYFENVKIKGIYEEEFKKANQKILKLFSLRINVKEEKQLNGGDLILSTEPHLNLSESKSIAQRLFRDNEMNFKVLLSEDYKEVLKMEDKKIELKRENKNLGTEKELKNISKKLYKFIMENSITISKGYFYELKNKNLIKYEDKGFFILDESVQYTEDYGINYFNNNMY